MLQRTKSETRSEVFAGRLRELRKEHGMTQEMLSSRLGISRTTVANWESGKRLPDFSTLSAMAKMFLVPVDYLCGITEERYNINFSKGIELDMTKLNGRGINMLCEYYKYLISNENYREQ